MTPEEVLALIRSTGYWRVVIRPTAFDAKRATSLGALEDAVRESRVMFRGWDYPHLPNQVDRLGDHIQAANSWMSHHELWRAYLSGQFVHLFSFREDYWKAEAEGFGGPAPEPGTALSLLSTLYSLTEITNFAARFSERLSLGPSIQVEYRMFGIGGRQLQLFEPGRVELGPYRKSSDQLHEYGGEVVAEPLDLVASANEIAVDFALDLFQQFNWEPARESVQEDQRRFLERRA